MNGRFLPRNHHNGPVLLNHRLNVTWIHDFGILTVSKWQRCTPWTEFRFLRLAGQICKKATSATLQWMHDHFDVSYTKKYRSVFNVKIKLETLSASSAWVCSDLEFNLHIENGMIVFGVRDLCAHKDNIWTWTVRRVPSYIRHFYVLKTKKNKKKTRCLWWGALISVKGFIAWTSFRTSGPKISTFLSVLLSFPKKISQMFSKRKRHL